MAKIEKSWWHKRVRHLVARQWSGVTRSEWRKRGVPSLELQAEARELHDTLSHFLLRADGLHPSAAHASAASLAPGTDWRWQPGLLLEAVQPSTLLGIDPGANLGHNVTLWHDCGRNALTIRQKRNDDRPQQPAFSLALEVYEFTGSYLSLSLKLPDDILPGLGAQFVVRLDLSMAAEQEITVYARLNLVQGPNVETVLRQAGDPIAGQNNTRMIEFDLAYADLVDRPIEKVWLDLIFEEPHMNAITVSDLVMSRRPRAEI